MTAPVIDGCIVINLPQRTDRWELFQKQLPLLLSLGLKPERIDAVYGRNLPGFGIKPWFTKRISQKRANGWGGKAGCTLSHRQAIATAKARGWKTVLILEDDVAFEPSVRDQWPQLVDVLRKLPDNWVLLYLFGSDPSHPIQVIQPYSETTCYEIGGAIGAVAYVVNSAYFDLLLAGLPQPSMIWSWTARHKTVDRWYSRQACLFGRVFAMSPFGIAHLETPSDATTAGEAYEAPTFHFKQLTRPSFFPVRHFVRRLISKSALTLSCLRLWVKRVRGL